MVKLSRIARSESAWLACCLLGSGAAVAYFVSAGHAAAGDQVVAPLDDTYIHFQYAKSVADGHAFRYHPDDSPSSGATSPIYIAILAVFYALGFTGASLWFPAIAIGAMSLGLAVYWLSTLAKRLSGFDLRAPVAVGLLGWGWLVWHAASGMEGALCLAVLAFAFLRSHDWLAQPASRSLSKGITLACLGLMIPLLRPSAVLVCLPLGWLLFVYPVNGRKWFRVQAAVALLGALVSRLFWQVTTGQTLPNGARAKWLLVHPTLSTEALPEWLLRNLQMLGGYFFGVRVDAVDSYTPPIVFGVCIAFGLAWVLLSQRARRTVSFALFPWSVVGSFAVMMTYGTYGQHYFRYTTPYAPLLFAVGLAGCAATARWLLRRSPVRVTRAAAMVVPWLIAAPMWLTWSDAAQAYRAACRDIAEQHFNMARQLRALPSDSIVGLVDAGVMAYLGERRTVDVVGLTTNGASTYYLSGPGSQLEFLEQLPEHARPTHYVTYRGGWFHPSTHFGQSTQQFRATAPSIVGGSLLELWPRSRARLGLGALDLPQSSPPLWPAGRLAGYRRRAGRGKAPLRFAPEVDPPRHSVPWP